MASRPPANSAYGDDISDDEEAELKKLMESNEAPEEDDKPGATSGDDDGDDGDDGTGSPPAPGVPPPAAPPAPATPPASAVPGEDEAPAGQTEDERLAAFMEKHKGKPPEEIARIAFQQQQRAHRAEFDGRKTAAQLQGTLERIQAARTAATEAAEAKRAAFAAKLAADPDAALLEARTEQLSEEERATIQRLEAEEFEARATAAVEFASAVIPDFAERAPAIRAIGLELGYTAKELEKVVDGRQIVTLHLAAVTANMIKAGLIDPSGRFLQLPQSVEAPQGQPQGQQRGGFSRQPARGAGTQKTLEQQLADVANMSDADLDKLDPAVLEQLLRDAEAE